MGLGDKYVLEVPIGESETGTVWAAKEASGGRRVVIAILEEDAPEALKSSFEAQAQALCGVHHPNVVRALEAGRNEDGAPYLVMERLEGTSLAKRWATSPPLRADRTLEIGIGVIDGLAKVHETSLASGEKLVHGDVEPGNVILVGAPGKEVAKLIGFGLNRATTRLGSPGSRASLSTLEPFAFAAPEQARGEVDASVTADLYSAAALLFAGLTGRPPHVAENASALADAVAKQPAPAFISLRKDLAPFAATLDRALASDPQRRYADGHALARALRTALAMGRIVGSKETPVGPRLALAGAANAAAHSSAGASSSPGTTTSTAKSTEEGAKLSETTAKLSETTAKPAETAAKLSETGAKPVEPDGKPTEPMAVAPDDDGKPTAPVATPSATDGAPTEPVKAQAASGDEPETGEREAAAASRDGAIPSGELELVSGELTLEPPSAQKSARPPPPPMGTDSIFEVESGVVQLEEAPPKAASVRPPPPPSGSGSVRPPAKPVHGWMPAPEPSTAAESPSSERGAVAQATAPAATAPATAQPAADPAAASPKRPSTAHDESSPAPAMADASPVVIPGVDSAPSLGALDEPILPPAANGPPMWLVAALAVTVLSLGGIYAFVRFGQPEPPATTGSLGTILTDTDEPPHTTTPPVEPPVTAPPVIETPPVVEPPPVVERPPVIEPPPVVEPPPTPRPETTGTRTATGTGTGTRATGTGTRTTTGTRATAGTRTTSTGGTTSMATTSMTATGSGRTTVVTDPGF